MRTRTRWLAAAAVAGALALAGTITGIASAESNGGVKVMPLGDSITEGTQVPGGYRIGLWQRMASGGYRVDFVGSQFNGPGNLGDHDHEGHPGWRIDQIDANISGWLRTYNPHTVLLHIGTNDVLQNYNVSTAPNRLSTLIDHITTGVPSAEVFVAQLTPLSNSGQENAIRTFNAAIPGIVQSKVNAGKHVHLVDMHSALTTGDLTDGIHPTANGYDKMAARWYSALQSVPGSLSNTTPTSAAVTTRGPTSAVVTTRGPTSAVVTSAVVTSAVVTSAVVTSAVVTSAPPTSPVQGGRSCAATYAITGQWPGGFQGAVTVTAGATAISSWTVRWTFANGQAVTQAWSATVTSSGSAVTATNVDYNGALGAGASAQFGFLGNAGSTNSIPSLSCTAA